MRRRIVAANWKMTQTRASAVALAAAVKENAGTLEAVKIVLCPPFPYLSSVADAIAGSRVRLGAQNCYIKSEGAFTGEVSPAMLADVGCAYVILGHSERRRELREDDAFINQKVRLALEKNLRVILCVGETLIEQQEGRIEEVFFRQLATALVGLSADSMERLVIAYEPVWAIGTGHTATPDQAQVAHNWIRQHIAKDFGENAGSMLPILYGGSVSPETAPDLFKQPDVDGGLVGTASWKAEPFLKIVQAAAGPRGKPELHKQAGLAAREARGQHPAVADQHHPTGLRLCFRRHLWFVHDSRSIWCYMYNKSLRYKGTEDRRERQASAVESHLLSDAEEFIMAVHG